MFSLISFVGELKHIFHITALCVRLIGPIAINVHCIAVGCVCGAPFCFNVIIVVRIVAAIDKRYKGQPERNKLSGTENHL